MSHYLHNESEFPPINPNINNTINTTNIVSWKDVIMRKKHDNQCNDHKSKTILKDMPYKDKSTPAKVCKIYNCNTESNLLLNKEEYDEIYDITYLGCDDYEVESYYNESENESEYNSEEYEDLYDYDLEYDSN